MWMLSFVPDAWLILAVYGVLAAGAGLYTFSYFTAFVPALIPFKEPIRIIGTVLAVAGVYFYGSYDTEESWRSRVAEAEARVARAEVASQQANDRLVKKSAERVQAIREKGLIVKQYIDREVVRYDESCKIPDAVVRAHNAAAKNEEIK
jgi:hypothetical protein